MSLTFFTRKRNLLVVGALIAASFVLFNLQTAHAAVANTQAIPKVSFTFDDGPASNINTAAPALAKYGYTGTAYISTQCVGMVTIPNKCEADTDVPYMSWAQVKDLQNIYGWEIGSHSVSHPLMTEINAKKLEKEVADSKAALVAQGFNPTAFATPYGDYNDKVLSAIAKYYTSHRGFADTGYNTYPYNNYLLRVQQVQYGVSVDTVKSYIDQAIADNTWLILVFHEVRDVPSTNVDDYQYATSDLEAIAAYAQQAHIKNTNITAGLVTSDNATDNLVTNPVDGTALGNGWTTDVPANVSVNTASNGSSPEATNSVAVKSNANKNVHIFSPIIAVDAGSEYVVKGYVNMSSTKYGTIGCYIDEYDAAGNWISGQYLQTLNSWYMRDISFVYVPTSSRVAKAQLQIILSAQKSKLAYIDSLLWYNIKPSVIVIPPDPTPEPVVNNLLTNASFADGLTGWSTNASSTILLDTQSNGSGSEATNAVQLTNTTSGNTYLFSGKVAVTPGKAYTLRNYIKVTTFAQDIGYYIDEYDAAGNWISGQYLYTKRDAASGYITFDYTPTSANVASASLQVIMVNGSGTSVYMDDFSWIEA